MSRLGSITFARQIANHNFPEDDWTDHGVNYDRPPKGFKFLGNGWSRAAFLGPDNVVYKRPAADDPKAGKICNFSEAARYDKIRDEVLKKSNGKIRLAQCRVFRSNGVLAMEYIPEPPVGKWGYRSLTDFSVNGKSAYRVLEDIGLDDLHAQNMWLDKQGHLVVFDYAVYE